MATTYTYGATLEITAAAQAQPAGDWTGNVAASLAASITFDVSGGTAPTITGWLRGTGTAAAGDLLLAHASDPFQGMGDAAYSPGFTVASSKLKFLMIKNNDTTNTITVARGTTNGLPIFTTAEDSEPIGPGGIKVFYNPVGTAALTTGSNDKLTVSVSGGSPTFELIAYYGP